MESLNILVLVLCLSAYVKCLEDEDNIGTNTESSTTASTPIPSIEQLLDKLKHFESEPKRVSNFTNYT